MFFNEKLRAILSPQKRTSPIYVVLAMLSLLCVLTSCSSASSDPRASLQLYQPRVLQLQAGVPVQTRAGRYTPQVDETWHSASAYEAIEQNAINLAAALAQKNNNPR